MQAVYVLILALFLSMVMIPPLSRLAGLMGIVDKPSQRKIHGTIIPRTGGIAIVVGALIPILLWVPLRQDLAAFLIAAGVLFVFGVLDDRFNLDYRLKFGGQFLASLIVTLGGGVLIQSVPFLPSDTLLPPFLSIPLTVIALVGITNAVNLSDGLDGLAGGISLLALGCLGVLAYQCGDTVSLMVAFAIMGAIFGFLRFNTNPAQIFMGDTGSQFLGFSAGALAIVVTQSQSCAVNESIPLLVLGLPILDTLTVMFRRISQGRSPFSPDRTHLHHRLLDAGMNQPKTVVIIYGAQTLLILLAYLLRYNSNIVVVGVYLAFCAAMLAGVDALNRHKGLVPTFHLGVEVQDKSTFIDNVQILVRRKILAKGPRLVLLAAIPLALVLGTLAAPDVSTDVAVLCVTLLLGWLSLRWFAPEPAAWIERFAVYVIAVAVVYLAADIPIIAGHPKVVLFVLGILGLVTAIWVRFASVRFQATSLDVLILIFILAVPGFAASEFQRIGLQVIAAIVLFYALEVLISEKTREWDILRLTVLGSLTILSVRGFLGI